MISDIMDNGGRRLGFERRQFSYDGYIPERRSRPDRRREIDRRVASGVYQEKECRAAFLNSVHP
jgi:hypothetical protein